MEAVTKSLVQGAQCKLQEVYATCVGCFLVAVGVGRARAPELLNSPNVQKSPSNTRSPFGRQREECASLAMALRCLEPHVGHLLAVPLQALDSMLRTVRFFVLCFQIQPSWHAASGPHPSNE